MNQRVARSRLGRWVKSARKKLGKGQDDWARELECSGVHISQIERGRRAPSNDLLLKMSRLVGCNKSETRGLLLLRARAGCDVSPEDFAALFGDTKDMYVVAGGSDTKQFLDMMGNAERILPKEDFDLLNDTVMRLIGLAKKRSQRQP